jgi:hypothetical protein
MPSQVKSLAAPQTQGQTEATSIWALMFLLASCLFTATAIVLLAMAPPI